MTTIRGYRRGLATQTMLFASYISESPLVPQDSVNMRGGCLTTGLPPASAGTSAHPIGLLTNVRQGSIIVCGAKGLGVGNRSCITGTLGRKSLAGAASF